MLPEAMAWSFSRELWYVIYFWFMYKSWHCVHIVGGMVALYATAAASLQRRVCRNPLLRGICCIMSQIIVGAKTGRVLHTRGAGTEYAMQHCLDWLKVLVSCSAGFSSVIGAVKWASTRQRCSAMNTTTENHASHATATAWLLLFISSLSIKLLDFHVGCCFTGEFITTIIGGH